LRQQVRHVVAAVPEGLAGPPAVGQRERVAHRRRRHPVQVRRHPVQVWGRLGGRKLLVVHKHLVLVLVLLLLVLVLVLRLVLLLLLLLLLLQHQRGGSGRVATARVPPRDVHRGRLVVLLALRPHVRVRQLVGVVGDQAVVHVACLDSDDQPPRLRKVGWA